MEDLRERIHYAVPFNCVDHGTQFGDGSLWNSPLRVKFFFYYYAPFICLLMRFFGVVRNLMRFSGELCADYALFLRSSYTCFP